MYADLGEYQECVRIWNYALGLKIMKETLLSLDTGLSLRSLVQLYLDLALRQAELGGQAGDNILHMDRKIEKLSKVLHFKCLTSYFLDAIASIGLHRILTDEHSPCRMFISFVCI